LNSWLVRRDIRETTTKSKISYNIRQQGAPCQSLLPKNTRVLPPEHGPASGAPLDAALIFFRGCARRFILVNASE
jgi:hypothetical protein